MEDPQKPRLPKLTEKQEAFATAMAKTNDPVMSATVAYDTNGKESARVIANRLLQKAPILEVINEKRKTLKQALIDRGIDEDKIAEKVGVLLEATDEDGNTDYNAVDKGLKHATAIHGVMSPEDGPRTQNIYNFVFTDEGRARISTVEAEIKEALTKAPIHVQKN